MNQTSSPNAGCLLPIGGWQPNQLGKLDSRVSVLNSILNFIKSNQDEICLALESDLGKSRTESMTTEIQPVINEIEFAIGSLSNWMKPENVDPAKRCLGDLEIVAEPLGKVLIIAPWNYPFQLAMTPLISAIAAGNSAVVKPSEISSHTSALLAERLPHYIAAQIVQVVVGGSHVVSSLLKLSFDHIFFTGSQNNGKAVLRAAAENLTPVTLELGGKCPCIVDAESDLEFAARRIVWGKFCNAGQTCVAPDYVLVHQSVQDELCRLLNQTIEDWFGNTPCVHPDYGRIINQTHFRRLRSLVQESGQVFPATANEAELFIPPTVFPDVGQDSQLMTEEIFGPFLPILPFDEFDDAIEFVNQREKALAVYLFSNDGSKQQRMIDETRSGGCCINDVVLQITDPALPFGGVGKSGMGRCHGKAGFDTFSNLKSVFINRTCREDPRMYRAYRRNSKG